MGQTPSRPEDREQVNIVQAAWKKAGKAGKAIGNMVLNGNKEDDAPVVVLVGVTGAGKSTVLDAVANYDRWKNISDIEHQPKRIELLRALQLDPARRTDFERGKSVPGQSQTAKASKYKLKIAGTDVIIIDTPGLADTGGFEQDQENIRSIQQTIKDCRHIHSICFVVNGRDSRAHLALKHAFSMIVCTLPAKIRDQIIVICTNCEDEEASSFQMETLEEFIGGEVAQARIFYLENPHHYHAKLREESKVDKQLKLATRLDKYLGPLIKLCDDVGQLLSAAEPVERETFEELYSKIEEVENDAFKLRSEYEYLANLQKQLERIAGEIQAAKSKEDISRAYEQKIKVWRAQSTGDQFNTICLAKDCHSNCHIDCKMEKTVEFSKFSDCIAFFWTKKVVDLRKCRDWRDQIKESLEIRNKTFVANEDQYGGATNTFKVARTKRRAQFDEVCVDDDALVLGQRGFEVGSIEELELDTAPTITFMDRSDKMTCKKCGCSVKEHQHVHYKFEQEQTSHVDHEMKQRFQEAHTEKEMKAVAEADLRMQIQAVQEKLETTSRKLLQTVAAIEKLAVARSFYALVNNQIEYILALQRKLIDDGDRENAQELQPPLDKLHAMKRALNTAQGNSRR